MKRGFISLLLIAGAALFGGVLFDVLLYRVTPGISFPLFITVLLGSAFLLARRQQQKINVEVAILAALAFVLAFMVVIRANELLVAIDIVVSLYLFMLVLINFAGATLLEFKVIDYARRVVRSFGSSVRASFTALWDLVGLAGEARGNTAVGQVGRGILITVPALLVFTALFASADMVFNKYIANLAEAILKLRFFEHVLIVSIASGTLMGLFAFAFHRRSGTRRHRR